MSKQQYNFHELNVWYNENKQEILRLAGPPIYKSIYDQALEHFKLNETDLRNLTGDIFTVTFDNL